MECIKLSDMPHRCNWKLKSSCNNIWKSSNFHFTLSMLLHWCLSLTIYRPMLEIKITYQVLVSICQLMAQHDSNTNGRLVWWSKMVETVSVTKSLSPCILCVLRCWWVMHFWSVQLLGLPSKPQVLHRILIYKNDFHAT